MSERPRVQLIPWDPESPEHIKRLFDQRVACSWNYEKIEYWRDLQRGGKMTIQWITLLHGSPDTMSLLALHTTRFSNESNPLTDTATSFGGQPRSPDPNKQFIPIGHVSLDTFNPHSADLADPARGIYSISTFYVSSALQSHGLGNATMSTMEATATGAPLNAKVLALNTLAAEEYGRAEMWAALETPVPSVRTQEWYERRGYIVFDRHEKAFSQVDKMGKQWWMCSVLMRKEVT